MVELMKAGNKRIAELERQLAEAKREMLGQNEMPAEVTVVLPVRTGLTWPSDLPQVFYRLSWGAQSVPLRMFVGVQEVQPPVDGDGTCVWLKDRAQHPEQRPARWFKEFKVFPVRHMGKQGQNLCAQLKVLVENVETEYILFVESDTLHPIAPSAVRILVEALQADPELAMVGYIYERKVDHVNMGATLARTSIMKDIGHDPGWKFKGNCVCRWLYEEELPRRGLKALNVQDAYGFHLKQEK